MDIILSVIIGRSFNNNTRQVITSQKALHYNLHPPQLHQHHSMLPNYNINQSTNNNPWPQN
jgi:hypothetical protein